MPTPTLNQPPGSSPSTAARVIQVERTVVPQLRVFRLPKGWRLVLRTGPLEHGSRYVVALYRTGGSSLVRIAVQRWFRENTLTFTLQTAATNKTPRQGRAGPGSRKSGRRL